MSRYFIGVDVGGTKTTALVADVEGNVAGIGAARGGNPRSSGAETAEVVAAAAAEALGGIDPSRVAHGVVAVAGGVAGRSAEEQPILRAWSRAGLSAPVTFVPDVLAAFRAGTPARRGAVLVAGTGAVAAVVDGDAVARRAGGHGWLVGDEGSAVWLGIRGVRAVLHALDGRGPATSLTTAFVEAIGIDADADPEALARALVDHVYAHPPADLGRLARPVVDACAAGDAVASELVRDAAVELTGTLAAVVDHTISVVVLAGSLLTDAAPLADLVRSEVRRRWRETTITTTRSGAPGAVALAIELHTGAPPNETVLASLRSAGNTDRPPA